MKTGNKSNIFLRENVKKLTTYLENPKENIFKKQFNKPVIYIGAGTCGLAAGADKTRSAIKKAVDENNLEVEFVETGCIGYCEVEPVVDVKMPGKVRISFSSVTEDSARKIVEEFIKNCDFGGLQILGQYDEENAEKYPGVPNINEIPYFRKQLKVVLENCGIIDPVDIEEYISRGGFSGLYKVLKNYSPKQVIGEVIESGLRGRGGGGFPTGKKWAFAYEQSSPEKYIICNADEGDPGAFMDRSVLEGDPYRIIEGMIIGGYAIGAEHGYIYTRAEYPLAIDHLQEAIDEMKNWGLLGEDILGSGFNFELKVKKGAGAFVCGEETALIASIEGKRGMPKYRPPYPAVSGLWEKPTIINNVETFGNIPSIFRMGAKEFAKIGTEGSKGTKVFALSGKVKNNGLVEIPMGITLREIIFDVAGGVANGKKYKAAQIGGPSGGCLPESLLDTPIDYESLKSAGAMMGSGGLVVMDEDTCMVDVARYFMEFIQKESCGKCIPCREGTIRLFEILERVTTSAKAVPEIDRLERFNGIINIKRLAQSIKDTALCGLGQTAANPVLSTLRYFSDEYEEHIFNNRCPSGECQGMTDYRINPELCKGCTLCKKKCPTGAIVGEVKHPHYIIADKCIGCGACEQVCKFKAVGKVLEHVNC
jgi:NADH:ubiquinone oxidoreductase subunit F (NADH-binding)/Pyruvate/2-oxoacid:ferredoxin oxidoreductase delta subunit/(2Fe-2S) ferredoxin